MSCEMKNLVLRSLGLHSTFTCVSADEHETLVGTVQPSNGFDFVFSFRQRAKALSRSTGVDHFFFATELGITKREKSSGRSCCLSLRNSRYASYPARRRRNAFLESFAQHTQ